MTPITSAKSHGLNYYNKEARVSRLRNVRHNVESHNKKHQLNMKILSVFFILIFLNFYSRAQEINKLETPVNVTSYNSIYKGYRAGGMIFSDSVNKRDYEYLSCCYDNKAVLYYNFKSYHDNGVTKLDSTLDMMSKRKAKIIVKQYNNNGKIVYMKRLTTRLEGDRKEIPKRIELLWSGKVVRIDEKKKTKELLKEIKQ